MMHATLKSPIARWRLRHNLGPTRPTTARFLAFYIARMLPIIRSRNGSFTPPTRNGLKWQNCPFGLFLEKLAILPKVNQLGKHIFPTSIINGQPFIPNEFLYTRELVARYGALTLIFDMAWKGL